MSKRSDGTPPPEALRKKILGLGSGSIRKTYFQQLQEKIETLERNNAQLQAKTAELTQALTDLKAAELKRLQMEDERSRLAAALEQTDELIFIADTEGNLTVSNAAFSRATGFTHQALLGNPPWFLRHTDKDQEAFPAFREIVLRGKSCSREVFVQREDGSRFLGECVLSPIRGSAGSIVGMLAGVRDVSEDRKREEQVRQAQRMEAVGRLAGGIAHDFNNLLTPILGFAELLEMQVLKDEPKRELLHEIRNAARKARDLTQQLLAFSRKQVLEMRPLDLPKVVANFSRMLRRAVREDVKIHLQLTPTRGAVLADSTQLEQILMNLAVNAQDAMPKGGDLTIETNEVHLDVLFCEIHPEVHPGWWVVLTVTDTGSGIDPELQKQIFEPFFTTKDKGKGTGLGLATVYGIVKQHNGTIFLDSHPGRGTTFRIYFPRIDSLPEMVEEEIVRPLPMGRGTLLVVEDNLLVRELTCRVLRQQGFRIIEAANGAQALEFARGEPGAIDLLLTDVIMPGINGKELFEQLVQERPTVQVLYMSGYTDDVIVKQGILDRETNFIQKPFEIRLLAERILKILAKAESRIS